MPVVMEISFYHYYSGKSLMRLQSRDCTFVQKAGFSLQFHCRLTVKVCSVDILVECKFEYQFSLIFKQKVLTSAF